MPITIAQAAGLTAVVGAAGFAAMSYLSSPADTNNTFIPPSANQGEVVYVAQGGGSGFYESNGEVASTFKAAPSRSIQLANQQEMRTQQTRALEDTPTAYDSGEVDVSSQMPKAYQMSGADLGLGSGSTYDKQAGNPLEAFSSLQKQISGVGDVVAQAQAQAQQGGNAAAASGTAAASGQTAAKLASAPRNWGSGGLTRAGGGGSGSANTFTVQDSHKNAGDVQAASAMAQAGNAMAQAREMLASMQEGGPRMRAGANFGNNNKGVEGITEDKDAAMARARRYGNAKAELTFIRKKSAEIAKNKTNAANEGGTPFLASTKISGGITVDEGSTLTTKSEGSSGDLRSTADPQMKGVKNYLDNVVQANQDERELARHELKEWLWKMLTLGVAAILTVTILMSIARHLGPVFGAGYAAAAWTTAAVSAGYIWWQSIDKITHYNAVCGHDKWTLFGWGGAGLITGGIGLALFVFSGPKLGQKISKLLNIKSKEMLGTEMETMKASLNKDMAGIQEDINSKLFGGK